MYSDTIVKDKAAVLLYLRMKHKLPSRGYILCGIVSFLHLPWTRYSLQTYYYQSRSVWVMSSLSDPAQHVSRTVVHNVLVGSVSFANPAKAMHNASTAQEIEIVSPTSPNFQAKVGFLSHA